MIPPLLSTVRCSNTLNSIVSLSFMLVLLPFTSDCLLLPDRIGSGNDRNHPLHRFLHQPMGNKIEAHIKNPPRPRVKGDLISILPYTFRNSGISAMSGLPCSAWTKFLAARLAISSRVAAVADPICGKVTTFVSVSSGCAGSIGS